MKVNDFIRAARVPNEIPSGEFGIWSIYRVEHLEDAEPWVGFDTITILRAATMATIHRGGTVVMEDSLRELGRHLPIAMAARGRVLITGLGLGCVVRGLLAKPEVEHVDVVELDADIIRVIGSTFAGNPRVTIHHGDALALEIPGRWDFAWHDLWVDGDGLQVLHARLMMRFMDRVGRQGAWAFPRWLGRRAAGLGQLLGSPKLKGARA